MPWKFQAWCWGGGGGVLEAQMLSRFSTIEILNWYPQDFAKRLCRAHAQLCPLKCLNYHLDAIPLTKTVGYIQDQQKICIGFELERFSTGETCVPVIILRAMKPSPSSSEAELVLAQTFRAVTGKISIWQNNLEVVHHPDWITSFLIQCTYTCSQVSCLGPTEVN